MQREKPPSALISNTAGSESVSGNTVSGNTVQSVEQRLDGPQTSKGLQAWLTLPGGTLEPQMGEFTRALERASIPPEEQSRIAERLLDLLRERNFGKKVTEGRSARRLMVETLLRFGYPWALHLEPDDVVFARLERTAVKQRWLRRVAVAATLGAVAAAVLAARKLGVF
jgi:hypothetical protein